MGSDRFSGSVAIVTGAGSGIGAAIARGLAGEGAAVVLVDRREDRLERERDAIAAAGGRAEAAVLDVRDGAGVRELVDGVLARHGAVDVLVNNAAVAGGDGLAGLEDADWDEAVDVALKGAFLLMRAVLPAMVERGGGSIVNVASVNGLMHFGNDAYGAAKAGLIQLTRSVAVRYGPDGVRANAVAPGTVRTPAWSERLERDPALLERLARWYPLRRVGEPEEVAHAVLFLASPQAAWITGATLPVDGGLLAGNAAMTADIESGGTGP
jgi:meso-butanediol dehydrogenase / (S,S)-butanediol dehydrogenase / diacetyl reductase